MANYMKYQALNCSDNKGVFTKIERISKDDYKHTKVIIGYNMTEINMFNHPYEIIQSNSVASNQHEFRDRIEEALEIIKTEY